MTRQNDFLIVTVAAVAIGLVSVAGGTEANADPVAGQDLSTIAASAAGPRFGTIVVEVTIPDRDALDELVRAGYNISNVRDDVVTIHATLDELNRLEEAGYRWREIEQHPQPKGLESAALGSYHNYVGVTEELNVYAEAHPEICRLYTLGQSVQGRELWALLISDHPDDEEDEPEFKYIGTMHGNESLATEMCLYFIDMLLTEYGTNERITNLIDSTVIWIVPLMNPDGLEVNQRENANGIDLNRNFPQLFGGDPSIFEQGPLQDVGRQPETRHIMYWTIQNSFVLSANFHTGALLVNYPYDNDEKGSTDSPSPDDLLFEDIARRYSRHNPPMWNSSTFADGITNGAAWYAIVGGMQDWNYRYVSCNEVTIELSNTFRPSASQLPTYWNNNSESMLSLLEAVHIGVRGIITDRASGAPLWAEVWVAGNSHPVFTDPNVGDYHRMLLPGTYDLVFHVPGYLPRYAKDVEVADGPATRVDIDLIPEQASPDFNRDKRVDIEDLVELIEHLGQDDPSLDIAPLPDGDGVIDANDLELLLEYWHEEIPEIDLLKYGQAYWKLDEAEGDIAHDSAGDNDGTLEGEPLWRPTDGKVGGALQLDGANDCVRTPFVVNPADGPFSAFAWIRGGAPGQVIISQGEGADWLMADPETGRLMTTLQKPRGRTPVPPLIAEVVITDGQWHRVGLAWDGSDRILYVDDAEVVRDTQAAPAGSTKGLYLGCGKEQEAGTFFSGLIDDVRVYNRAVVP